MLNIYPLMSDHPAAKKNEMLDIPARKKGMRDMPDPAKDHVGQSFPQSAEPILSWNARIGIGSGFRCRRMSGFRFRAGKIPPLFRRNTGKAHFEEDFPFVQAESKISA